MTLQELLAAQADVARLHQGDEKSRRELTKVKALAQAVFNRRDGVPFEAPRSVEEFETERALLAYYGATSGDLCDLFAAKKKRLAAATMQKTQEVAELERLLAQLEQSATADPAARTLGARVSAIRLNLGDIRERFARFRDESIRGLRQVKAAVLALIKAKRDSTERRLARLRDEHARQQAIYDGLEQRRSEILRSRALVSYMGETIQPDRRKIDPATEAVRAIARRYQEKAMEIGSHPQFNQAMARLDELERRIAILRQKVTRAKGLKRERIRLNWKVITINLTKVRRFEKAITEHVAELGKAAANARPHSTRVVSKETMDEEIEGLKAEIKRLGRERTAAELRHAGEIRDLEAQCAALQREMQDAGGS
jgi:hypothetical protein